MNWQNLDWKHKIIAIFAAVAAISFIIPVIEHTDNIKLMAKMLVFGIIGSAYYIVAIKVLPVLIRREDKE
ncbi:MAG: hypothetical protein KKI06_10235 [Euryarchaeota archaeon]|nr:hypothetical protein [Euryarchaeota archaeon]MBU4222069.1 hypothetical protein [Euryarchaeota archaeon]